MRPRQPTVYDLNALGVHFYAVGAYDLAIVQLEEAARLAPEIACIRFNLGGAYYSTERTADAEREFWQALDLDPGYMRAHWFRGLCLEKLNRLDEALEEFQWVLRHSAGTREARSAREEIQAIAVALGTAEGTSAQGRVP
jgi:tetratricopeptide (TPR) repeat protein